MEDNMNRAVGLAPERLQANKKEHKGLYQAPLGAMRPETATPTWNEEHQGLIVKDLNAWYGSSHAVRGISLHIRPRAITALIGPSGSGKSTFLRCLNRMHEVIPGARASGEVLLDGQNILDPKIDPVLVRWRIGMVFQR